MNLVAWIVLGLLAGTVAKLLMPGRDPGGFVMTIGIGVAGALVGGFLWSLVTSTTNYGDINLTGVATAVVGSMILLWLYQRMTLLRA